MRLPNVDGRFPFSWLLDMSNQNSCESWPMVSGRGPVKVLWFKALITRFIVSQLPLGTWILNAVNVLGCVLTGMSSPWGFPNQEVSNQRSHNIVKTCFKPYVTFICKGIIVKCQTVSKPDTCVDCWDTDKRNLARSPRGFTIFMWPSHIPTFPHKFMVARLPNFFLSFQTIPRVGYLYLLINCMLVKRSGLMWRRWSWFIFTLPLFLIVRKDRCGNDGHNSYLLYLSF